MKKIKKVTYWKMECLDDSDVYSIRRRTKKEALEEFDRITKVYGAKPTSYGKLEKVTVLYEDVLSLIFEAKSEGGLSEMSEQRAREIGSLYDNRAEV